MIAVAEWAPARLLPRRFVYPVAEESWASRRIAEAMGGVVVAGQPTRKYVRVVYEVVVRYCACLSVAADGRGITLP